MVSLDGILREVLVGSGSHLDSVLSGSCTPPGSRMASYFEEHDCEPTDPEEQYHQNALLELAR